MKTIVELVLGVRVYRQKALQMLTESPADMITIDQACCGPSDLIVPPLDMLAQDEVSTAVSNGCNDEQKPPR